jgi:hypothetical protein
MKLCINCVHHVMDVEVPKAKFARCGREPRLSPVDGSLPDINDLPFCSSQRIGHPVLNRCGLEATHFEEKANV